MSIKIHSTPKHIWLIGSSFVLFQFFLQLSSGVVIGAIMHDMQLSALVAGLLSSSFYIVYTLLQIPVGILFDNNNPRTLLSFNALLCSIGCLIFSASYSLTGLFIGRTLIGAGSAFAFVGLTHLLRQHFPLKKFAFLIGLSETLGFLATVIGIIGMGAVITTYGWRKFIIVAAIIGMIIACFCWRYIPNEKKKRRESASCVGDETMLSQPLLYQFAKEHEPISLYAKQSHLFLSLASQWFAKTCPHVFLNVGQKNLNRFKNILRRHGQQLSIILSNKLMWANGLFIGLSFSIVTVFGALWAASFIQIKLGCSLRQASLINAMFFLGTGFSCPLFGGLSNYFSRRKPLILSSILITIALLLLIIYLPIQTISVMAFIMFMVGLCCGAYILAYPIANELSPPHLLSTSTGFTNTLALISTPLLQPLIGYLLDLSSKNGYYSLADYQNALLVIPGSLLGACILVYFCLRKKLPFKLFLLNN